MKNITSTTSVIDFEYNPFGQRILKKVKDLTTGAITNSYYAYDANGQVMGVYTLDFETTGATLNELNIYGASRLGIMDKDVALCIGGTAQAVPVYPSPSPVTHILGYKKYEITNYLGNVNAVINDRKIYTGGTYTAVMLMNSDYYPFGMQMPGRHTNEDKYRFGYNGMEMDNEAKGNGNSYTTEFRQYDPRLGRWLSLDPLMMEFPWMSPYVGMDNNPVLLNDPSGLSTDDWVAKKTTDENGVEHHKWEWVDKSYDSKAEALADGYVDWMGKGGVISEIHTSSGYVGPVTLLDGGGHVKGNVPEETAEEAMRGKLNQTQIDATFNPEKEIVIGTIQEGLAEQINDQSQAELDRLKYDMHMEAFNKSIDNLTCFAGAVAVSPFVIGGAIVYGGPALSYAYSGIKFVATSYHYTFGVNGGYVSMASNVINQTSTQLSENGNVKLGDFDLIALGSSGLITPQTSLGGQMIQGASGTYLSYSINKGFDGALIKKKSGTYILTSTLNGMLNPLMNKVPIVTPIGNEVITGSTQGVLNKLESNGQN